MAGRRRPRDPFGQGPPSSYPRRAAARLRMNRSAGGSAMRFTDRVAIVTAAASGIGRATADIIAREGGIVVAVDSHQERLDTAVDAMTKGGGRAHGRLCDALDQSQVDAVVASVAKEFG